MCDEGPFTRYERTVHADRIDGGGYHVHEEIRWQLAIPLWGVLFRPLVARQLRRKAPPEILTEDEAAARAPWWSPPARLDARSASVLSMLCGLSMLTGYLGTTITQTMTYAANEFGASTAAQGATLAAVRVGVLLSLVLVTISDRRGRHKLLLVCSVGGILASVAGAASPSLWALGGTQTFARAFATALALLIGVVSVEEMPAGGRAYAASVIAMTAALGAGVAVILLPLADSGIYAWRIIYVVPLFGLPFFVRLARKLPESRRFIKPHGKATMSGHRGRLGTAGRRQLLRPHLPRTGQPVPERVPALGARLHRRADHPLHHPHEHAGRHRDRHRRADCRSARSPDRRCRWTHRWSDPADDRLPGVGTRCSGRRGWWGR